MADNYLEKRMADYAAGRLNRPVAKSKKLTLNFPAPVILFYNVSSAQEGIIITEIVKSGATVAFTAAPEADGKTIAMQTGARYYPLPPAEVIADLNNRGQLPAMVVHAAATLPVEFTEIKNRVNLTEGLFQGQAPQAAAALILALCHPLAKII